MSITRRQDDPSKKTTPLVQLISSVWLQAGVAAIPYAGGPIQVYLDHVVTEVEQRQWRRYLEELEARLNTIDAGAVDVDYFASEDFILRLRAIHDQVVAGADDVKMHYLREYLVAAAKRDLDINERDLYLRYLRDASGVHLLVLRFMKERQGHLSRADRFSRPQRTEDAPLTADSIAEALGTRDVDLIGMIMGDLGARGLVGVWMGEPPEPRGWSIEVPGLRFMKFLTSLPDA